MKTYRWFFLVIVLGILASCGGTSEDELVGDWRRRAFFRADERSHCATFVIGDKGYVCCGWNGLKARLSDAYVFEHNAGEMGNWQTIKEFPGKPRSHAVGFSVNNFGYVGTGWDGDETDMKDFWRYNPGSDEWTEAAPLPEVARARREALAFSLTVGGKEFGYVGFGFYSDAKNRGYLSDLWQFDPDGQTTDENGKVWEGSWTEVTGYGGYKRVGAVAFVIDNKAYICNGKNPADVTDFWVFDPSASAVKDVWTKKRTMWDANPDEDYDDDYRGLPRSYGVAYVVEIRPGQPRGHIVGGGKSSNWEYDHDNDLWTQRTQFYNHTSSQSREGMVSFSFPNTGRTFVGMGKGGVAYYDDMWEFIPLEPDYIYDDF